MGLNVPRSAHQRVGTTSEEVADERTVTQGEYYQLIRLTRSPNGAKITRYRLTSMTGYLPAPPTWRRIRQNGSPLSTSNIRTILAETR